MPTPVAHALAGTAVYLAARQDPARKEDLVLLGGTVFAACAADLDFGISFLTSHNYHHYFTHSLGFATLFCLAAYFLAKWAARPLPERDAWILGAAYLTHIVLDLFSKDTAAPFGVELLWPFSDAFTISPRAALRRHLERDAQRALRAPQLARGGAGSRDRGTGRRVCEVAAP